MTSLLTRTTLAGLWLLALSVQTSPAADTAPKGDPDRGREAMTARSFLKPAWSDTAYANAKRSWEPGYVVDQGKDPSGYDRAFLARYGLHAAPFPNGGLPMGLKRANGPNGTRQGVNVDCLLCHGGSIGGTSYVGLGNSTMDLKNLFDEMNIGDGKLPNPPLFVVNTARGTVNAGMMSAVLLSFRNPDLSFRTFPLPLGASLPELDVPAWWLLKKKQTMYFDGRTDARAVRTNMQFLLGEKSLQQLKDLEPTFRDIQAFIKSLTPPKYPFPIDEARATRGKVVFEANCAKCHGTYGDTPTYPNKIIALDIIGTDPERSKGMSDGLVAHYKSTWLHEDDHPVTDDAIGYQAPPLDGVWATAPYLHNGSVPTLSMLLDSKTRPKVFLRPRSTNFDEYDQTNAGWKVEVITGPRPSGLPMPERRRLYDTSRFGLKNTGHTFGDRLSPAERADVIEYLKTL